MATIVVYTTLMVLLSKSNQDFKELWDTAGAVNDPTSTKHVLSLEDIIRDGNFKSALVDEWTNLAFDSVSLYGTNSLGDVFWETELNVTGTDQSLISWLVDQNIVYSSSTSLESQVTTYSNGYRFRLSPVNATDRAWFSVSYSDLSYGPLPLIFVPRHADTPFSLPVFEDGRLGCWYLADLINVVFKYEDAGAMSPDACIAACWDVSTIAMLSETKKCYCADVDANNPPTGLILKCYLLCPGTLKFCGGFDASVGNAYHVQGSKLPGYIDTVILHETMHTDVNTTIKIDASEISYTNTSEEAFVTQIAVNISGTGQVNYTVKYSNMVCSQASGHMKNFSVNDANPTKFQADGSKANVDILKVKCIELVFDQTTSDVSVKIYGPNVTSDYVEIPALAIRGKNYIQVNTTTSTTTSTAPTVTNSTAPTVTTSTAPTATTSTAPTVTNSTAPTVTTSTAPTATTSTAPATMTTTSLTASSTTSNPSSTTGTTTIGAPTTTSTSTSSSTTSSSSSTSSTAIPSTTSTFPASATAPTPSTSFTSIHTTSSTSTASSTTSTTTTPSSTSSCSTSTSSGTSSGTTIVTNNNSISASICFCPCTKPKLNLTEEELQEVILQIQLNLSLNVSQLSSTIRKLTSAYDKRVSAAGIGYIGVAILIFVAAALVMIDSTKLLQDTKDFLHNIKKHVTTKTKDEYRVH